MAQNSSNEKKKVCQGGTPSKERIAFKIKSAENPSLFCFNINHVCLQIFFQSMFAIGATYSRFTPSGMESLHCLKVFTVDVGLTKLQGTHDLECIVQILCVKRGSQSIFAIVCPCDSLVNVAELYHRQYRTECLFADDVHVLCCVVQ